MNVNVKQTFFKKLRRKIQRFSMDLKHKSLIFVVGKTTLWTTCSKSTLKTLEQGVKYV